MATFILNSISFIFVLKYTVKMRSAFLGKSRLVFKENVRKLYFKIQIHTILNNSMQDVVYNQYSFKVLLKVYTIKYVLW